MNKLIQKHALFFVALGIILLFHGTLLVNQSFYRTYDALIHIFFASHYANAWFDPWEPRWYTGFTVFSYPPLSHQLIALLSWFMDLRLAFGLVQFGAICVLALGIYRFSQLLGSTTAAGLASLLFAVSSSLTQTVHVYGQLPTILSLGLLLNALPFLVDYIRFGRKQHLYKALILVAATTTAHHVTTIFGSVFFILPLMVAFWLPTAKQARPLEPSTATFYRMLPTTYRSVVFLGCTVVFLVLTVLPYWLWSRNDPITQTPIPHASRDNFIQNPNAGLLFFVIPWSSLIIFLPNAISHALRSWRWAIGVSLMLLFILGTGGTTPLPKLMLGPAFDILTLERFTFWATILILPFAGISLERLLHSDLSPFSDQRQFKLLLLLGGVAVSLGIAIYISGMTRLRQFQPEPINVQPIVEFINKDEHWRYRYLTLGFGDQMAWLSANTKAQTPDGNYHSARRLIELTKTSVERLDGAKFRGVDGIGSLEEFLTNPERFHLKFIFSNDTFYDPLLFFMGWHKVIRLENGIMVWEREDIPPLPERLPRPVIDLWQRIVWGSLPMLILGLLPLVLIRQAKPDRLYFWHRYTWGKGWLRRLKADSSPRQLVESEATFQPIRRPRVWLGLSGLVGLVLLGVWLYPTPSTPEKTIQAYWNDLDFGRFRQSFDHISKQQGLTLERYLLERSIRGGLIVNYAKLSKIKTTIISSSANQAVVQAEISWLTSLSTLTRRFVYQMVLEAGAWKIKQSPSVLPRPTKRFSTEPALEYDRAPRRLTTLTSDARDILDRPQLEVISARLVTWKNTTGQLVWSVIGELENIDARPADCTVTVVLRDQYQRQIAQGNAGMTLLHKLLPGERTAFRVDFTALSAPIKDFEVIAKAVVTQTDLERPLAIWVKQKPDRFEAQISNLSNQNVVVSRAFFHFYDASGLAWSENQIIENQILPSSSLRHSFVLTTPKEYRVLAIQRQVTDARVVFDNKTAQRPASTTVFNLPWSYRIQMQAFLGTR